MHIEGEMSKKTIKMLFTVAATIALAYTPVTATTPAFAYDENIEIVL